MAWIFGWRKRSFSLVMVWNKSDDFRKIAEWIARGKLKVIVDEIPEMEDKGPVRAFREIANRPCKGQNCCESCFVLERVVRLRTLLALSTFHDIPIIAEAMPCIPVHEIIKIGQYPTPAILLYTWRTFMAKSPRKAIHTITLWNHRPSRLLTAHSVCLGVATCE